VAKRNATITVDGDKLAEARRLARVSSNSGTIDMALNTLIGQERLRHDLAAYAQRPPQMRTRLWASPTAIGATWPTTRTGRRSTTTMPGDEAPSPRRADVWLARLDKARPVVVLTRDPLGRILHSVIVGPVTSTVRGLSTEVPVGPSDGVARSSVVNPDNTQLVSRDRLVRRDCRLATGGPEALVDALGLAGSHDQQAALVGRLWRLRSDATLPVLEAIGAAHPAKAVAKAARKACFQHRSWAASA